MNRLLGLLLACLVLFPSFAKGWAEAFGYVVVTDYIKNDGKRDVSDALQKIIDEHPNRTIYFPDGVYLISKPILTPADPKKSVALQLSNFAIIRATEDWAHTEAMIRLGGKDPYNDITIPGSNYYLDGGIIDGIKKAKCVSIDGGRETVVRNTSIKNAKLGLHIKKGANSGSSDCDIHDVNIVGTFTPECIGVLVDGYDNTFTNMRIGGVHVGVHLRTGGNYLRNIHPLYYSSDKEYETSCGFIDESNDNWFDFCYSDEFATAFRSKGQPNNYHNCFAYWYSKRGKKHLFFKSEGPFRAKVMNATVGFGQHNATKENKILECEKEGGDGFFFHMSIVDESLVTDTAHKKYCTKAVSYQ